VLAADMNPRTDLGFEVLPQTVETFLRADLIVLSPGVPVEIEPVAAAKGKGIPVIGEVELAGYFLRGPIVGITGSNGKTTTTAMIGHILGEAGVPRQIGGNIGTPPCAMIDSSRDNQWNVLELSSFQLETVEEFRAAIAVGLNVTPDHLDRHGTFENYANAKARLFECQPPPRHGRRAPLHRRTGSAVRKRHVRGSGWKTASSCAMQGVFSASTRSR
jgi:UDP-N-acetylmuramoylalanine--D-glutamate ligase